MEQEVLRGSWMRCIRVELNESGARVERAGACVALERRMERDGKF
jgi:hypothetical protein